jgi:hypothetical protein
VTKLTTSGVVRAILSENLDLSAEEVLAKARSKGLKSSDDAVRKAVYNIKGELKKARAKTAPAAAHETTPPKVIGLAAIPAPVGPSITAPFDLTTVLANVALVNTVAGQCGGFENTRRAAEAVRACGGVDAFLQHLDLVAGIRAAGAPG